MFTPRVARRRVIVLARLRARTSLLEYPLRISGFGPSDSSVPDSDRARRHVHPRATRNPCEALNVRTLADFTSRESNIHCVALVADHIVPRSKLLPFGGLYEFLPARRPSSIVHDIYYVSSRPRIRNISYPSRTAT